MKEATGELNMTVITVVAIAAIGAFFMVFVWPRLKANIDNKTKCASAICNCATAGTCACSYIDEDGNASTVNCVVGDSN